jgi:hypothetical protein
MAQMGDGARSRRENVCARTITIMTTEATPTVELSEIGKPEPVDVITSPPPEKTTEEKTAEAARAAEEAKAKPEEGKTPDGVQKRIDELTKARRSAEREVEYWKRIATQKAQTEDKEPTPDQFENYDAYIKALATHAAKMAVSSAATETASQHVRTAEDSIWESKLAEAQSHIPDYKDIVGASEQEVAPHVVQAIRTAEHGPELVYHLAKHPALATRLNELSPMGAAIELGRIEATLGAPPPPKPASNAPEPIKPIAAARNVSVNLETAEMTDYIAARRKQGARF